MKLVISVMTDVFLTLPSQGMHVICLWEVCLFLFSSSLHNSSSQDYSTLNADRAINFTVSALDSFAKQHHDS